MVKQLTTALFLNTTSYSASKNSRADPETRHTNVLEVLFQYAENTAIVFFF